MRKIIWDNEEVKNLLKQKQEIVLKARELNKKMEEAKKEFSVNSEQMQKYEGEVGVILDKVRVSVEDEINSQLQEFEEISTLDVVDDKLEVVVEDVVELFKKDFLEKKNKKDNKEVKEENKEQK